MLNPLLFFILFYYLCIFSFKFTFYQILNRKIIKKILNGNSIISFLLLSFLFLQHDNHSFYPEAKISTHDRPQKIIKQLTE